MDERYSLLRGGLLYRISRAAGIDRAQRPMAPWIAGGLLAVVLVPALVLAAMQGTLMSGVQVPLARDHTVWMRFLLSMPLLVLAAPPADAKLWRALHHLRALVQPDDTARFEATLARLRRWRDSIVPELALFVLAVSGSFAAVSLPFYDQVANWRVDAQGLTPAGMWIHWVGMPVFRFLALLWTWRLLLWVLLLWRFARLDLALHAAHPDGRGGLAFLGLAQTAFIVVPLVGGLLVAGSCAVEIEYLDVSLRSIRFVLIGYVVVAMAIMMAPLLLMTPRLAELKRNGLLSYGALGTDCTEEFEGKWLGRARGDAAPILEAGDASALVDLTGVYATVAGMVTVPIQRYVLFQFLLASIGPLLPLALLVMPMDQLVDKLFSALV